MNEQKSIEQYDSLSVEQLIRVIEESHDFNEQRNLLTMILVPKMIQTMEKADTADPSYLDIMTGGHLAQLCQETPLGYNALCYYLASRGDVENQQLSHSDQHVLGAWGALLYSLNAENERFLR